MSTNFKEGFYYRIKNQSNVKVVKLPKKRERKGFTEVVSETVKDRVSQFQKGRDRQLRQGAALVEGEQPATPGTNGTRQEQQADSPSNQDPPDPEKNARPIQIPLNTAKILRGEALQKVDPHALDRLQDEGTIKLEALNIEAERDYVVANQTAKRISIRSDRYKESLVIPPFGSRTINSEILKNYDFIDWERQYLISLTPPEVENNTALTTLGFLVIIFGLFLVVGAPLAVLTRSMSWVTIGITSAVFAVLILIALYFSQNRSQSFGGNLWEWVKLLPGILLVVLAGAGLPLAIVYVFGGGSQLITVPLQLASLGRSLQVGFIAVASLLPALLFYLFGRQQVKKQRQNFFREVMSLDPNVQSLSEARTKYEPLLDTVYDSGNSPLSIILLLISTSMLVLGWIIALEPVGIPKSNVTSLTEFFLPEKSAFTFGFLGAYFFTLNLIFRRYVRADLTPKTYAFITVRFLITVVLVWVVSSLPQFANDSIWQAGMLAIIFIVGLFPDTGLALIEDYVKKIINRQVSEKESLSLTLIEGINLYDRARLLEEGIENLENLAHHNLIELVARTRIPTSRLVDMFDQAILYLHLGLSRERMERAPSSKPQPENPGAAEQGEAEELLFKLKSYGIRTATDLVNALKNPGAIEKASLPLNRLNIILDTMSDDEWFEYIKEWRISTSVRAETVTNPYDFYVGARKKVVPEKELKSDQDDSADSIRKNGFEPETEGSNPLPGSSLPAVG